MRLTTLLDPAAICRRLCGLLVLAAVALAGQGAPRAELRIDITQGNIEPLPIAVTDFFGVSEEESRLGKDIAGVITGNLERSGLFRPLDRRAFVETVASMNVRPQFANWRVINAQALVVG